MHVEGLSKLGFDLIKVKILWMQYICYIKKLSSIETPYLRVRSTGGSNLKWYCYLYVIRCKLMIDLRSILLSL